MPTYTFRNKETNEIFDQSMKMSEYDSFMESNPSVERYYEPSDVMNIVSKIGGIRTDDGFKEVLSKVAQAHPNSELASRVAPRSIRQAQVDRIVDRYRK